MAFSDTTPMGSERGTSLLMGGGKSPDPYGFHCHCKFEGSSLLLGRDESLGSLVELLGHPYGKMEGYRSSLQPDKCGSLNSTFAVVGGGGAGRNSMDFSVVSA